jgi:cellulose synthase (UDP-forming)
VRWIALVALLWGAVYLTWRVGWTHTGAQPEMYAVLLVAELVGWVNLVLFTFLAWRVPPTRHPAATPGRTVDVIVPTYDEPPEVLRATLLGCRALTYPHTTWLLDDGRRPEMAVLARELGANYLTRPDNSHAKAGNINHALPHLSGELIAVLDADHVPLPHFLDALVGYFDDDKVVLVQAPHEFYNLDSIQHVAEDRHEQSLFFRIICPGKDRHDGAFWCGSGTVIRREPLIAIGGVQTATIAEDFHTTIPRRDAAARPRPARPRLVPPATQPLGPRQPARAPHAAEPGDRARAAAEAARLVLRVALPLRRRATTSRPRDRAVRDARERRAPVAR